MPLAVLPLLFAASRRTARAVVRLAVLALPALPGCSDTPSEPQLHPMPVALSVTPELLVAGGGVTTLTVTGSGFILGSQARWKGADRATTFQDAQTLQVDLSAADIASVGVGTLTVVNGPPGGGESGELTVMIGYPAPTVTTITPSSTAMRTGGGALDVTIVGTGFTPQTYVRFGENFVGANVTSATELVASVPDYYLGVPGNYPVTVVNPTPGGGTSNAVSFAVAYPVPVIGSLSPDSALTGSAFTLTVNGTGFGTGTQVRWNGTDRATTFVSATRVTAAITAADVASATDATVTVFNPAPGGGTSNAVAYRVREASPVITAVSPGVIPSGSGATAVTITGTNFRAGATAQWNGADRPATLAGSTSATVTLSAADVASPTVGHLTITNPGASGQSNSMAVAVIAADPSLVIERTIPLTHTDVVYDDTRGVLYASIPSSASANANTVLRIDPLTGTVTDTVSVGSNPATLAITEDGQYLYVALLGAPRIARVALASFTKDIDILTPSDGFFGNTYAEDIVPIPGAPQTIAVSTFYTGLSPRNAGTFLYDNAVRRTTGGPGHTGSNRITRGPTGTRIFGYNNETTEFGFRSLLVLPDGLREETVRAGLVNGFGVDIEYGGGFVYATTGEVVDVGAMQKVGTIPASGTVRPDAARARVHFLNGNTVRTYHYTAFSSIGSFSDASLADHTKLVRWGTDGLAVGGGASIVLLRGALVAP